MKALRIILASIRKADEEFNLFKDNTSICIGISGGKDSMALLYCLHLYQKYAKINFEIKPMTIDLGFPNSDFTKLKEYVSSLGYDLYIKDAKQVYEILKIQEEKQNLPHLPCSICSRMKKAIINKVAEELNCNHVSFAHHKDDAIETLFLNEIYGGRIGTFAPKMYLTNDKITFIRPFIYVEENTIKRLIKEENIPVFPSTCPNDKHTKREDIKNLLNNIYKQYPSSKDNFLTMLNNKEKLDVFFNHFEFKVSYSKYYFKHVEDLESLIKEMKFLKIKNIPKANLYHLHYYKNDTLLGIINIAKNDRNFTIKILKFKNYKDIDIILYDLYEKIYSKYNPINFDIEIDIQALKTIKFLPYKNKKKLGSKYLISLIDNPVYLLKELKINNVIKK